MERRSASPWRLQHLPPCSGAGENRAGAAGRIVAKRDAIGIDVCEVKVEGIERPIELRQRSDAHFVPGNDVVLTLNPKAVLVFKAD